MSAGVFQRTTRSESETEAIGGALAKLLPPVATLALHGDLASGKTALVRGLARGLGYTGDVNSPTFTLINQYGESPPLYHLDLYRLSHPAELLDLGIEEIFEQGLVAIEWAERAEALLPDTRLDIQLEHAGSDTRSIRIHSTLDLPTDWIDALASI